MKHTPGPWKVESDASSITMGNQVVITGPAPDGASREEEKANAQLIAAAPDLLAACEKALPQLCLYQQLLRDTGFISTLGAQTLTESIEATKQAIAKAK